MRTRKSTCFLLLIGLVSYIACAQQSDYQPKRVNKCVELWIDNQPVYYVNAYGGYEEGKDLARTWADYITYNMEHNPLDFTLLREFMKGLVDGGPTPSGHRTPTVIAVLPGTALDVQSIKASLWMIQQALAQGVHGVSICRARDPEAIRLVAQAIRYPFNEIDEDEIGDGLRGYGRQKFASWVWGVDEKTYLKKADLWPLNPDGEIILGVKIEDREALKEVENTLKTPGLAFAEHGPRDMGFSYNNLEGRADPPLPVEVVAAGEIVMKECKKNNLAFLDNVLPDNVIKQIDRGVLICAGGLIESAKIGRKHTGRKMPY